MWEYYLQLTEIEQAFKELKGDLELRKACNADLLTAILQNQGFPTHRPLQSAKTG